MGGIGGELNNGLRAERTEKTRPRWLGFSRLSTPISNTLKVLAGFIPALVTFLYTQEWWVLAWFGAPLWFLITGLRNIPQAILGGGGMWSRSLLRWNDYVSWHAFAIPCYTQGCPFPCWNTLSACCSWKTGWG